MPRNAARPILVVLLVVAALGVPDAAVAGAAGTDVRRPSPIVAAVSRAAGTRSRSPAFEGDFADPFVLQVGTAFYAYATNTPSANIPVGGGRAGQRTRLDGDALPKLPSWSEPGHVWAPAVTPNSDGYLLYYTTRDRSSGRQCVSVASASSPVGPFVDSSSGPLECQVALGGSIDPSPIDVDGVHYLMWKNDGNCCNIPTRIWIAPLTEDGRHLEHKPVALLGADQPWEHGLIEGPSMIENDGRFYLFYSANRWDSASYAMGYAVCASVTGPCRKPRSTPWLASKGDIAGPGGGSAFQPRRGPDFLVFAAWSSGAVGYDAGGARRVLLRPLRFVDGAPVLGFRGRRDPITPRQLRTGAEAAFWGRLRLRFRLPRGRDP